MAKLITKEQMAEQESYIMKLKEENMRYAAQNGHAKLALTETYGCQQNENDTERIRGMLRQAGFDFTDDSNKADVVIYNTCAVRENAEQKVFGRLGYFKAHQRRKKRYGYRCMRLYGTTGAYYRENQKSTRTR